MNFSFASTDKIFPKVALNRGDEAPMDIDQPESASNWLKLEPSGEPPRKRSFLEANLFGSAKKNSKAEKEGLGVGGPFLFKTPTTMDRIREIDYEKMDIDFNKPFHRSQDNQIISPNAARKVTKDRNSLYQKVLKPSENANISSKLQIEQDKNAFDKFKKLTVTPKKSEVKKDATVSPESSSSDTGSLINLQTPTKGNSRNSSSKPNKKSLVRRENNKKPSSVDDSLSRTMQMHKDIPYVVSGYFQLLFNVLMATLFLVIIYQIIRTIYSDIDKKVGEYAQAIINEIAACKKNFIDNRCDPLTRVPAMDLKCIEWENCMIRDPYALGRGKISAETFAEIINGFIEPISLKTMAFFVLLFFGTIYFSNVAFSTYRKNRIFHTETNLPFPQHTPGYFLLSNQENFSSYNNSGGSHSTPSPSNTNFFTPRRNSAVPQNGYFSPSNSQMRQRNNNF